MLPLIPFFIKYLGGSVFIIGIIGGLREGIGNFVRFLGGFLFDRIKKKKLLLISGYGFSSLFKLSFPFAKTGLGLSILVASERIFKGLRSAPRDAILAQSKQKRVRYFSFHRAMDTLGAFTGGLVLVVFLYRFPIRNVFLIAGIIAILAVPFVFFIKVEKKEKSHTIAYHIKEVINVKMFFFLIVIFIFNVSLYNQLLFILRAEEHFSFFYSNEQALRAAASVFVVFNLFYSIFSFLIGIFSKKVNIEKMLFSGFMMFAFISLILSFKLSHPMYMAFVFVLYGFAYALVNVSERVFFSNLVKDKFRASILGLVFSVIGFASLLGGFLGGWIWQRIGYRYSFYFASILSLVSALLFLFFVLFFKKRGDLYES